MGVKIPVDFTGVEARGSVRVPEGDYVAKLKKVEKTNAKSSGNPMLVCRFELVSGPSDVRGKNLTDRHILVKDSLWTLRNMLEAMGLKVPSSKMKLDTDSIVGRKVGLSVIDGEEYKGRIKSEIADYLPTSAVGERVTGEDADEFDSDDEEDDGLGGFADEEEPDTDDSEDEESEESDEEEGFDFNDEEEESEDEEEESLSFTASDVEGASAAELKQYLTEAMAAGWEFELPTKPKKAQVVEALLSVFADEEDEDDDEMEGFDLDDVE